VTSLESRHIAGLSLSAGVANGQLQRTAAGEGTESATSDGFAPRATIHTTRLGVGVASDVEIDPFKITLIADPVSMVRSGNTLRAVVMGVFVHRSLLAIGALRRSQRRLRHLPGPVSITSGETDTCFTVPTLVAGET
jgi:hypothetical protein